MKRSEQLVRIELMATFSIALRDSIENFKLVMTAISTIQEEDIDHEYDVETIRNGAAHLLDAIELIADGICKDDGDDQAAEAKRALKRMRRDLAQA
jgi:hypothetical protein